MFNNRRKRQKGKDYRSLQEIWKLQRSIPTKDGTIKDKNGRDPVDSEKIKEIWKEYMEELCKKDLNELDYYEGVVSDPEPDILECEVKWVLRSTEVNKASGCDEIPTELFRSLNVIKVFHSLCQQIWKTQQWPQDWKRSILISIPKKGSTKECANHWIIALSSHASKVMLKILHARLQHYMNKELPDVQAGFR